MRRSTIWTVGTLALVVGAAAAQTKITTLEEYAKVMKSNAQSGAAMNTALAARSYPDARKLLATVRGNFTALHGFWAERKRDDAVSIVKSGLNQIDAMDKMLASDADVEAVRQASAEFGRSTSAACHKLYREGDDQTGFRFKPGVF